MLNDTLIKVFDEYEYLYNVMVPLSLPFKHVVFLHRSDLKMDNKIVKCATELLKGHGRTVDFLEVSRDTDDISELLKDSTDATVDIGGSHRYLSFYLFEKIINQNRPIIYYDMVENVIKNYRTHSTITKDLYRFSIKEMISLSGALYLENMHETPDMADEELVNSITNVIEESLDDYPVFTRYIGSLAQILPPLDFNHVDLTFDKIDLIKRQPYYGRLERNHIIEVKGNRVTILKPLYRHLLKNIGSWLESYLYIIMQKSELFDDVKMSAVIDYHERGGNNPISCEIDVVGIQNNRLVLISCKSNKVETNDLHEIKVHNLSFGNFLSKAVICTIDDLNVKNPVVFRKAKEYDIAVIDKTAFVKHQIPDILNEILKGHYHYEIVPSRR